MPLHYFPFGKYQGKGVSQTALTVLESVTGKGGWGYSYLVWAHDNMTSIGAGLRKELARHQRVLNEFQSVMPCQSCGGENPTLLSLIYGYGSLFANGPFVYHDNADCTSRIYTEKSTLVRLGFDALCKVAAFDKGLQKTSHETLRHLAGWDPNKKVTEQAAAAFIDELEQKNAENRSRLESIAK